MLTALNNSMSRCGQGRADAVTGFYFGDFDTTVSSYRVIIDNNNLDTPVATQVVKAFQDIPLTSTQFPALLPRIDENGADIAVVSAALAGNSTGATTNAAGVVTNVTNITSNDVDIATNVTNITAKQNTLTWSTVTDDHATNPVTSKDIKSYVDAASGGSGATLGSNTFTGTQKIETNVPVLELIGANQTLQISAGYGPSSLYVGEGQLDINGDRVEVQATSGLRVPRHATDPTIGTNNSRFGCVYYNTTSKTLFFHDDSQWVELATV